MQGLLIGLALSAVSGLAQDTVVPVEPGMRLEVDNREGSIRVTTWNRDAVEITTGNGGGRNIEVSRAGSVIRVNRDEYGRDRDSRRRRRDEDEIFMEIRVPAYLRLDLSGIETDISIEGVESDVRAVSVEGTVTLRGGSGTISLHSTEEDVVLEDASGRITVNATEGEIRLTRVQGEVRIESVDGDIFLTDVDCDRLDAATVDGDIVFDGVIRDGGRYRLETHDGDVTAMLDEDINASVTVSMYEGDLETSFPIMMQGGTRHRFQFSLGSGSAVLNLSTFDGDIFLRNR